MSFRKVLAVAAVSLTAAVGLVSGATARSRQVDEGPAAYALRHPGDFVGLDRAAFAATGEHPVISTDERPGTATPAQATSYMRRYGGGSQTPIPLGGIPTFSLGVAATAIGTGVVPRGKPLPYVVTGSWNFPDSWAGQASPTDEATLQFDMPSCVHMSNFHSATYTYQNRSTNLAFLKSSNVNNKAPIWSVSDKESSFVSQADHGTVSLQLDNTCGKAVSVGADFTYEANQGGSLVSVSAGWGFLSLSYSSAGLRRQQGTAPLYFTMRMNG
jgi:hypothetical protein